MKDWKWASVRGWPERMMAARSHSMSSGGGSALGGGRGGGAGAGRTLVEIALVEVVRARDVHVVETGNLQASARALACSHGLMLPWSQGPKVPRLASARTLRWPRKCCSSLISRRARLARIFLLKTLVTFLMATPSWVWLLTAALSVKRTKKVSVMGTGGGGVAASLELKVPYHTMP